MRKEFYIGQPLIAKGTGERMIFLSDDGESVIPISVWNGNERLYCHSDALEPSTEFKFSEIIAGLEQEYFEEGTEFRRFFTNDTLTVKEGCSGLYLKGERGLPSLTSKNINSKWDLVEHRKEMTLEEVEAELGYKIKLKEGEV